MAEKDERLKAEIEERRQAEERQRLEREEAERVKREEAERKAKKRKKGTKIFLIVLVSLLAAAALAFAAKVYFIPQIKYNNACRALEAQNFGDAHDAFVALGGYKDSADKARETIYRKAVFLMDSGEYIDAVTQFDRVQGYQDSAALKRECYYRYGNDLFEEKRYDEAYSAFHRIPSYKDSLERATEAKYLFATACYDAGKYKEAYEAFKSVKDYEDSSERYLDAAYLYASERAGKSDWKEASKIFKELKDYKDSEAKYMETHYQYGLSLLNEKKYKDSVSVFESLKDYQDSGDLLNEAKYGYVETHKDDSDKTTYNYLKDLQKINYKDSKEIYKTLYVWTVTAVINDSETNETTNKSSISKYKTIYCHYKLSGGPPSNEGITLKGAVTWPDGGRTTYLFEGKWGDGDSGVYYCWYNNPAYGATGTLRIYIYNNDTGDVLGEFSVTLTR